MTKADTPARRRPVHCLIITLSDRAVSGAYADRSGPRTRELLESFFADHGIDSTIEHCLLPDDATLLRREVLGAREQGVDVIITTGGTGVGLRDIAPETIAPLCEKLMPGIMEHVRAKFGANNPRARLSPRSPAWPEARRSIPCPAACGPWKSTCRKSSLRWSTLPRFSTARMGIRMRLYAGRIKLFGPMSRAAGQAELNVTLQGDAPTCAALRAYLVAYQPRLAGLLDGCRFAVNGRFAAEGQLLAEGDEIALIGFVSGG